MSDESIKLTDEQANAIHTRGVSIALSAGAGCGKTFVLTQRFLRLLQPGCGSDPLGGIVAITFTDRAAREMRDRIRAACYATIEVCPEADVDHWQQVIRGLDAARISTIHAFCASLLRAHAVDVGIDPGFEVLERATSDALLGRAIAETVHEMLAGNDPDCTSLVRHYGLDRTQDMLRALVLGLFRVEARQFEGVLPEGLASDWLGRWQDEFVPLLLQQFSESAEVQAAIEILAENEPSHAAMQQRRAELLCALPEVSATGDPLGLLEQMHAAAQVRGGGGKAAWQNDDVYEIVKNRLSDLRKAMQKLRGELEVDRSQVDVAVRFSVTACRVIEHASRRFAGLKQQAGLFDFDDLLVRTRDLLRDSGSARRAARTGIDYLMVDEFQDTDPVQAEIVRLLAGEDLLSGRLFVVGDVKQSIYRFRRADPGVFEALRNEIPKQGRLPLSTNFRSQPEILKFVNMLFAPVIGESYEPLRAHVDEQISPTPAVEFLFATPAPGEADDANKAQQRREREADWIARRIAALLQQAEPCVRELDRETGQPTLRKVRPGDVAILFRTLSNVAIYEEALERHDLPYYLVGGRAFYAQQEIYDLINLCQYLDDRDDAVSLAGVLRSPFFSLTDETLLALVDHAGRLHEALALAPPPTLDDGPRRRVEFAASVLDELYAKKDRLPLADLLNLAIDRTGYDASLLAEFLGSRKLANLNKLIDMARQFDASGLQTLSDFADQMRRSILEQTDEELAPTHPETSNVIRLMTIHQSKGLEFPVVIVADMDWNRRGIDSAAHFHPTLGPLLPLPAEQGETPKNLGHQMHKIVEARETEAEEVRLLYVATTRAADYLVLSAGLNADRQPRSPWLTLLASRFHLWTGVPLDDLAETASPGKPSPADVPEVRVHVAPPEAAGRPGTKKSSSLPPARFREAVENARGEAFPESVTPRSADPSERVRFSPSAIEEADAKLRGDKQRGNETKPALAVPASSRSNNETDATQLGDLVHAALERIDLKGPVDVAQLIDRCSDRMTDKPSDAIGERAAALVSSFLDSPLPKELAAAPRLMREVEFLLDWPIEQSSDSVTTISGTIDCLMQSPDGRWTVIDYKTGWMPGKEQAKSLEKYEIQLGLYALAVRECLGRWPDAVELVFLGESVERVSMVPDEQPIEQVAERVATAIQHLRKPGRKIYEHP